MATATCRESPAYGSTSTVTIPDTQQIPCDSGMGGSMKVASKWAAEAFQSIPRTYDHWPQHGDEGAEPTTLLNQSLPDRLLLCLFQQEVLVVDVLESAVQLRLDIASPWK